MQQDLVNYLEGLTSMVIETQHDFIRLLRIDFSKKNK